mgnify:CR=1 FL=1
MSHRYLEVIYCDDIREEAGNKLSYMGVYGTELNVIGAPHLLAKLCVAIRAVTPIDDPFRELDIQVTKDGHDGALIETGPVPLPELNVNQSPDASVWVGTFMFFLSPFQIDGMTKLQVTARTERETLTGLPLRINVMAPSDQNSPA